MLKQLSDFIEDAMCPRFHLVGPGPCTIRPLQLAILVTRKAKIHNCQDFSLTEGKIEILKPSD